MAQPPFNVVDDQVQASFKASGYQRADHIQTGVYPDLPRPLSGKRLHMRPLSVCVTQALSKPLKDERFSHE